MGSRNVMVVKVDRTHRDDTTSRTDFDPQRPLLSGTQQ
jgi:hypothetical protein